MRYAIVFVIALSALGCDLTGPKEDLGGYWTAKGPGHTLLFGLTLLQSGDMITGKACASDGGILWFKDAPVSGDYPYLQFTVGTSFQFSGKQDGTKDIVGASSYGDLRFKRAITSICN